MCASVPALKPMVARVFPKLLLSDIYSRTKRYYGHSGGSGNHGGSRGRKDPRSGGGGTDAISSKQQEDSGGSASASKAEIKVIQSFEMKSIPGGTSKDSASGDGKDSRDGSENGLVNSSWQADCYTTIGHNNRMVKGRELF